MDWLDGKVIKNAFRIVLLIALLVVTYLFYAWYKAENLAEYARQNLYVQPKTKSMDSVAPSDLRAIILREIDSIKKASGNTQSSSAMRTNPSLQKTNSLASLHSVLHQNNNEKSSEIKSENSTGVLQGPSAFFSHTYTIPVGQTIPVNILWAEAGAKVSTLKLVTIKADDITDNKARFTIEDSFNVLVFSQTGYAAGDKIIIEDERHHLNIFIMQVTPKAAVVKIESHLDENVVSKLKRLE